MYPKRQRGIQRNRFYKWLRVYQDVALKTALYIIFLHDITLLYLSAEILQISPSVVFSPCCQSRQINILQWHCLCADFQNFKSCLQRKTQATFIRINATFLLLFSHVIPCGNIHFHLFYDNKLGSLCEVLQERKKHIGTRPGSKLGPALWMGALPAELFGSSDQTSLTISNSYVIHFVFKNEHLCQFNYAP